MDDLLQAIAAISTSLHRDRVEAIACAIARLESADRFDECDSIFGPGSGRDLAKNLRQAWLLHPTVKSSQVAFGLRAASYTGTLGAAESVDLVWTGPKTGLIPTRNTEQVILSVIDEASENLFIVSYVFYNAVSIVAKLNHATDRGVSVKVLLESFSGDGGSVSIDGLRSMRSAVPQAQLYIWDPEQKTKAGRSLAAAVHAKCAVADYRLAFITSANLTSAAMERNMELGTLLRGGTMASRLHSHLDALISTGTIVQWR